ncbi:MAG: SOS response-associated peptidase [Proteobacteria bacterium]|nr:SOS response-associated peptidase [Pseudomonadota bacterium]
MCGRYALHASEQEILTTFHAKGPLVMRPRYNIAPTQTIPVIMGMPQQVEFCRWGFIASWVKPQGEMPLGHIKARLDSLLEKPTFKEAALKRRCLIPASGYFEWRKFGAKKQPYYIFFKQQPLVAFAGIWSTWQSPLGEIKTCAIITHQAKGELQIIHERMPLVIQQQHFENWLANDYDFTDLVKVLVQSQPEDIGIKPVTSSMNHPKFEGPECIRALS